MQDLKQKKEVKMHVKYLAMCCVFIMPFLSTARVWTVDNSPGAGADTTSLPGCIFMAAAGDTIIVMPSYQDYGNITITKKLFIYSRGHSSNNLDKDKRATITNITISASSTESVIKGFFIRVGFIILGHNTTISGCSINSESYIDGNNNLIQGNVLIGINMITFAGNAKNNIIINNFFIVQPTNGFFGNTNFFIINGNSSNLFANNFVAELIFGSAVFNGGGFGFFKNSYIKVYNNILWSNVPSRSEFHRDNFGSVFKNNLTYSVNSNPTDLPGFNYNDTLPQFEGGYTGSTMPAFNLNNKYRLKTGSMGKNGGTDSTDVGFYGQNYNFSLEGNVPGIAIFDDFEVLNPVLKRGGTLKVKVVARKPE